MYGFIAYAIATCLFAVAGFKGGVHSTNEDLTAFGLAFFSLAHILEPVFPYVARRV